MKSKNDSILIKTADDFPFKGDVETYKELLKKTLQGRVKEAYLFGSVNTRDFSRFSDVDLILVVDTEKAFFERYKDFRDIFEMTSKLDLLIYTPEEIESFKKETTGFWKSVWSTAEKLI